MDGGFRALGLSASMRIATAVEVAGPKRLQVIQEGEGEQMRVMMMMAVVVMMMMVMRMRMVMMTMLMIMVMLMTTTATKISNDSIIHTICNTSSLSWAVWELSRGCVRG